TIVFGDGWYGQEGSGGSWWRWMAGESTIIVPGSTRDRRLHLVLEYPTDTRDRTTLYVALDGEPLEVSARPSDGAIDIVIPLPPLQRERTITMQVTSTVRPIDVGYSGDTRVLGARLVVCELG
ncbi:MAG TPA: hypothetical protein VLD39_06460, partial [Gammaproteobacteria bacterium]|nr:hypothetical protein [Gammaproteobacteria bacterium]